MGTSTPAALTYICQKIIDFKPVSVLDIGIGFGKYGFLAREYTDIYRGNQFEWKTKIDGIEGFEKSVTELQKIVYDTIYVGDATKIIKILGGYDLVLSIDMLEHVEKDKGLLLLQDIKTHSKEAIISLPIHPSNQGCGKYNNIFAPHRSVWTEKELSEFGDVMKLKDFNKQGNREELVFVVNMKGNIQKRG